MPLVRAFHEVDAVAHVGLEKDHGGDFLALGGLCEGAKDFIEVVAVSYDDVPAEGAPLLVKLLDGGDARGGAVYLLAVPVGHGDEVAQLVVDGEHGRFPNLAFLALAVAAEDEGPGELAVHLLAEGYARSGRETLAEGAGGLEDAGETGLGGRVALEAGAELTQRGELFLGEVAGAAEYGIIDGGEMPCGKDESVLAFGAARPSLGILLHDLEEEGGEDVGAAHGASGVPGAGEADHPYNVPAHLRGDSAKFVDVCHFYLGYSCFLKHTKLRKKTIIFAD